MSFIKLWFLGYITPKKMIDELKSKPAPLWGIFAQFVRSLIDAILLYLPLSLMGRVPPEPSYLSFFPTEHYYRTLVWLAPLVLMAELLFQSAVIHVVLRLAGRQSDFDQIINITGMAALVVGAFILLWDWIWILVGGLDQYSLGYSHLAISMWALLITVIGLKRILSVPTWFGVILSFLTILAVLPFAIMFMRSPL